MEPDGQHSGHCLVRASPSSLRIVSALQHWVPAAVAMLPWKSSLPWSMENRILGRHCPAADDRILKPLRHNHYHTEELGHHPVRRTTRSNCKLTRVWLATLFGETGDRRDLREGDVIVDGGGVDFRLHRLEVADGTANVRSDNGL